MKIFLWNFALCALIFAFLSCGPPSDHRNQYQKTGTYPIEGQFHEPVASVVLDRNERFDVSAMMGSALLINKREGIFASAKHVVGEFERKYKLFFCGRVYTAVRILDTGVTDVSFLKIISKFDPNDFPEPYSISEVIEEGEDVFVRGIHMHYEELQRNKVIHRIVKDYYAITNYGREFVYDNLPATIVDKEAVRRGDSVRPSDQFDPSALVQNDFGLETKQEHKISNTKTSFGGLSGGPTVNSRNEIVGINVVEKEDEGSVIWDENGINYHPRVTLKLLPSEELIRAMRRLNIKSP